MNEQQQHPQAQAQAKLSKDPFLLNYQPSDLRIASEFFTNWLPFLSRDLCRNCTQLLSDRIRSIDPESSNGDGLNENSNGSDACNGHSNDNSDNHEDNCDIHSIGSWKDDVEVYSPVRAPGPRMSWADMAQEDEFAEEEHGSKNGSAAVAMAASDSNAEEAVKPAHEKPTLPREQREYIRFMNVRCQKDYMCFERVNGKLVNILEGLELHTGIFSAAEQKRIVNYVTSLQDMGRKGELKDGTFSAPKKWIRGKGRQTIQFGCCYNYAVDKEGNPPGILQNVTVEPIPGLFKVIIKRLISWHILPPSCVPDSCIVNIYEEGDCIPPHIDNHDFLRPFCTVSFLSECNILFGSNLKILAPGEFDGPFAISLPVGSVLVLNGNGADVAKHCVPAVPMKRISITFRRMDVSKRPAWYVPESDLQDIQPLAYEVDNEKKSTGPRPYHHTRRNRDMRGGGRNEAVGSASRGDRYSDPRESNHSSHKPANRWSMGRHGS